MERGLPSDVELVVLNDLFSELESTIRRIEANRSVDVFGETMEELAMRIMDTGNPRDVIEVEYDEAEVFRDALRKTGGNREKTAELLGMSRTTLWRKLRELNITE